MTDRTLTVAPALTGTNQNVVAVHAGVTCVPFNYTAGGVTASVSDVIYLAKIPAGAIITRLDGALYTGNATSTAIDIGMSGDSSADVLVDGQTPSQTGATVAFSLRGGAMPIQVSCSDDAVNRFKYLQAKIVSGDPSTTLVVKGVVEYIVGRSTIA